MKQLTERLDSEGYVLQTANTGRLLKVFVGGRELMSLRQDVDGVFTCQITHYARNVVTEKREAKLSGEDVIFQCRQAAGRVDLNFRLFGTGLRGLGRDLSRRGFAPEIWYEQPRATLRDVVGVPAGEVFVGPSIIVPELGIRVEQIASGVNPVTFRLTLRDNKKSDFANIKLLRKELLKAIPDSSNKVGGMFKTKKRQR